MWLSNRDCLTVSQNSVSDWVRHKSDSQTVRESKSHSQTHNARINQSVSKWGKWLAYSLAPFNVLFKTAFRQSYWDDWARGICCWHRKFKNVSNIHTCIYTKRNLSTQTIFFPSIHIFPRGHSSPCEMFYIQNKLTSAGTEDSILSGIKLVPLVSSHIYRLLHGSWARTIFIHGLIVNLSYIITCNIFHLQISTPDKTENIEPRVIHRSPWSWFANVKYFTLKSLLSLWERATSNCESQTYSYCFHSQKN